METFDARLSSFKKSRRVKNPSKSSSTISLKWPHPPEFKANPETLAEAGFYYAPSYEDPDNVTCYICEKELGGWEENDDPFLIHWEKCGQHCCWASARCGLVLDVDRTGRFVSSEKTRLPSHKLMERARLETFLAGKGWIHDKTPNHGASSTMMARAGFVFTPQHTGDDLATCFYCNTSLSGWEPEDDPLEEHLKRENKSRLPCAFFAVSSSAMPSSDKPVSRAQTTKSTSKSKPASRSNPQDNFVLSETLDSEHHDDEAAPPTKPLKSTAKTPRKGRSTPSSSTRKSAAKKAGHKVRSSSRSGLKDVVEETEDEEEEHDLKEPQPAEKIKSRSRSKSVAKPEHVDPQDEEQRRPVRSRSKKATSESSEEMPRKGSRTKSQTSFAPGEDMSNPVAVKPSRAKSKGKIVDSEKEEVAQIAVDSKYKKAASRSKSKAQGQASEVDFEFIPGAEITTTAAKKSSSKPKPPQTPAIESLLDDDIFVETVPLTNFPSKIGLPPLFVPKRNVTKQPDTASEDAETISPVMKGKRKPAGIEPNSASLISAQTSESEPKDLEAYPSPVAEHPIAPASSNPSVVSFTREVPLSRSKVTSSDRETAGAHRVKVVEVSSDDEPEEDHAHAIPKQDEGRSHGSTVQTCLSEPASSIPSQSNLQNTIPETIERAQPSPLAGPTPSSPHPDSLDLGISRKYDEPRVDVQMEDVQPMTPPRQTAQILPSDKQSQRELIPFSEEQSKQSEPLFIPALSKIPFTPLHALTDAELDMTVEEWIRYQMEVEYDKFRRDGERELQRFRKRAEEVRRVIEGL